MEDSTIFGSAPVGESIYGDKPQTAVGNLPTKQVKAADFETDRLAFLRKFEEQVPEWWPRLPDGHAKGNGNGKVRR